MGMYVTVSVRGRSQTLKSSDRICSWKGATHPGYRTQLLYATARLSPSLPHLKRTSPALLGSAHPSAHTGPALRTQADSRPTNLQDQERSFLSFKVRTLDCLFRRKRMQSIEPKMLPIPK